MTSLRRTYNHETDHPLPRFVRSRVPSRVVSPELCALGSEIVLCNELRKEIRIWDGVGGNDTGGFGTLWDLLRLEKRTSQKAHQISRRYTLFGTAI